MLIILTAQSNKLSCLQSQVFIDGLGLKTQSEKSLGYLGFVSLFKWLGTFPSVQGPEADKSISDKMSFHIS